MNRKPGNGESYIYFKGTFNCTGEEIPPDPESEDGIEILIVNKAAYDNIGYTYKESQNTLCCTSDLYEKGICDEKNSFIIYNPNNSISNIFVARKFLPISSGMSKKLDYRYDIKYTDYYYVIVAKYITIFIY